MKLSKSILIILVSWLIFSCQHDEPAQQGNVQFSFSNASSSSNGRKQTDEIPDGASLIISITKNNGDSVFTWKKIALLKIGDQFITAPLPLLQGNYVITDFMIVGGDNTLLLLTPKQGSPLAGLVENTAPIPFSVTTNTVANVDVEVVDAMHHAPEDFGYVSFPINVVSPGFQLSVFVAKENGETVFTEAQAYILHGNDTLLRKSLSASVNAIFWNNLSTVTYTLVVVNDGYAKYKKEFTPVSLAAELNGYPLAAILTPAFTITWSAYLLTSPPAFSPNITIDVNAGDKLRIDWGDDIIEENVFSGNTEVVTKEFDHTYAKAGKYFVSITGDLSSVKSMFTKDYVATVHALSLVNLPELNFFFMGKDFFRPTTIDFSENPKLVILGLPKDFGLEQIDISKNTRLRILNFSENHFSTSAVDKIIDDLYASVTLLDTKGGTLYLGGDNPGELVGPPSPAQRQKLNSLINDYAWEISPAGPY